MINCITISPKHANIESITKFIDNGCNMFRLNFSWGTHSEYAQIIKIIKEVASKKSLDIKILQDLQGPKLRVQNLESQITISPSDIIEASFEKKPQTMQLKAKGLYTKEALGKKVLIKDGNIEFEIIELDSKNRSIKLRSNSHGSFKNMNGCNAPSIELELDSISSKDKQDLEFALEHKVDIVSLSFIHNESNLVELKKLVKNKAQILAKIETETAVNNIKAILYHADWCMVARGDLGVEVGLTNLGPAQQKILQECNNQAVPCLVATEVLKTMLIQKNPSRAESDDIYQCLEGGADGFILTNETVTGANPFLATKWITKFLNNYSQQK